MSDVAPPRWAAPALAAGAILNAVFLLTSDGHIIGAHFMTTPQWSLSHQSHFYAGILLLAASVGLYIGVLRGPGVLRTAGLLFTVIGSGLFVATGAITAFILPVVARAAPALLESDGALFNPPNPFLAVAVVTFAIGWFLTGLLFWKTPGVSRGASVALMAGALIGGLPPQPFGPFPFQALIVGSVVLGIGACWLAIDIPRAGRATAVAA